MRDPELVFKAQLAAAALERAWQRWRLVHGLVADPMPAVSSYVGYSLEEPWGQPRVVLGLASSDAEQLAALLDRHDCIGPVHAMIAARTGGEAVVEGGGSDERPLPVPPQAPSMLAEHRTSGNGRTVLKPRSWRADAQDGPVYRQVAAARWASVAVAVGEAPADGAATTADWIEEPAAHEAVIIDAEPDASLTDVRVAEPALDMLPEPADALPERADALPERADALPERADVLPERAEALPEQAGHPGEGAGQEQAAEEEAVLGEAGQAGHPGDEAAQEALQEQAAEEQAALEEAAQEAGGQDLAEAAALAADGDGGPATTDAATIVAARDVGADPGSDEANVGGTVSDASVAVEDAAAGVDTGVAIEDAGAGQDASVAVEDAAAGVDAVSTVEDAAAAEDADAEDCDADAGDADAGDAGASDAAKAGAESSEPVPDIPGPLTRAASNAKVEAEARIKAAKRQSRAAAELGRQASDSAEIADAASGRAQDLPEATDLDQVVDVWTGEGEEATAGADQRAQATVTPSEPGSRGRQKAGHGRRNRGTRGYPIPRLPKTKRSGAVPGS